MSNEFTTVLDECLGRLKAGDSIDACLERYPEHAEELEPLLQTVQHIEPLRFTEPPRPESRARGRGLFLAKAARMREKQEETQPSLLERIKSFFSLDMPSPVWGRAAAVVVIVLLLFGAVGRVVVQASESSLPGDPLYPVKQVTRQVQLFTTLSSEVREARARRIQAEEREEVQQATEQGRAFEEDVAGIITGWQPGNSIELEDGLYARVTQTTDIDGQPTVGHIATVHVRSENGQLVAERITVHPQTPPQSVPTETLTVTFTAVPTATPTNTPEPTKAPPTAAPTETPKPKVTDTPMLAPTVTKGPSIDLYEVNGPIESISDDGTMWVVAGQNIRVISSTIIVGEPAEGRIAHVQMNRLDDETFVAVEINVEKLPTPTPAKVVISGVLESPESPTVWYVSGQRIRLDDRSEVVGDMKLGAFVDVEGVRESSTTVYAEKITVVRTCENTVLLEGTIVPPFTADIWIVEVGIDRIPFTVVIDGDTDIRNSPVVGAVAQIEACKTGDTYRAMRIFVVPPPTPTNTAVPSPTPAPAFLFSTPTVSPEATPSG
ncbi:MAG: hypothetical protein MAG451_01331 [Anaerolineales bacterium]|nr:hypothetical protein [Anaerolineales bacterium]